MPLLACRAFPCGIDGLERADLVLLLRELISIRRSCTDECQRGARSDTEAAHRVAAELGHLIFKYGVRFQYFDGVLQEQLASRRQ